MEAAHSTRVVIIDTKYVQTDAKSFKTVVQKLTGKDSVAEEENRHTGGTRNSGLLRDSSFKEFQRVLREMPRIDELYSD
ncbi:VQ motif-containing protein 1-like [Benincasa hispida]|uniref:VQ motif-containing protein 1-like n=1 Tax=Benincasa hispida TaxID=102211 RepID=UPI0018FF293F|nr:VQ motif-containing protein 1-like [Benincasa hispida]